MNDSWKDKSIIDTEVDKNYYKRRKKMESPNELQKGEDYNSVSTEDEHKKLMDNLIRIVAEIIIERMLDEESPGSPE
jgi:hypothetical protein